jgi:hypothetical protein
MITDEMVQAAADAIGAAWDTDEDDDERMRVYARAALTAAAPLIAAAERDACLALVDEKYQQRLVEVHALRAEGKDATGPKDSGITLAFLGGAIRQRARSAP